MDGCAVAVQSTESRPPFSTGFASRYTTIKARIPLCRLPRDVRDKPVTSPLGQIPLR